MLTPRTLGSLEFSRILRDSGASGNETDAAPDVCLNVAPDAARIWSVVRSVGMGVFPASDGQGGRSMLEPWFPRVRLYGSVFASGLAAMNPVAYPARVFLNVGRIERSGSDFHSYKEGVTPGACQLI